MSGSSTARGIAWMVAGEMVFVAVWCAIKKLGSRLPLFEITFFRAFLSLFVLGPLTFWRLRSFRARKLSTILFRSVFGFIAMFMSFYVMIHMSIGNASTLINTMPVFVALMSPIGLKEPFSKKQFAFIVVAFAGIALILKPDAQVLHGPALVALGCGFMSAIAMICVKKLTKTDSTLIITFYFTAFAAACSAPVAALNFIMPTPAEWGWLIFIGFIISFAQLFMTRSYKYGSASTIALFTYSSVIGAYVAGMIFFDEIPDIWSIAGAIVIIASGIGVMLIEPARRMEQDLPVSEII